MAASGMAASRGLLSVWRCAVASPVCQLQDDLFLRLLALLEGDDVELTEEVLTLLRQLGATPKGAAKLMDPATLADLFARVIDGEPERRPTVVDTRTKDGRAVMAPFAELLRKQYEGDSTATAAAAAASSASAVATPVEINTVILMRVLTLLTQVGCAIPPAAGSAAASHAAHPPLARSAELEQLRRDSWSAFESRGLFSLLLQLARIAPGSRSDMLVQLNSLELLEEIVRHCPAVDEAFAGQLTADLLSPAVEPITRAASDPSRKDDVSILPCASFVSVGILRVLNTLAQVSAVKSLTRWYQRPEFLLFLSAAAQEYDDESVQTEAIDLLASLGSFAAGLAFFSVQTSTLPSAAVNNPAAQSKYLSQAYASAVTPVLLAQLPFFVGGASNYASGLRQIAAMHGMARMMAARYEENAAASAESAEAASSSAAAAAASSVSSSSSLLRSFFHHLSLFNHGRAELDVLLTLAKQPFEDVREAVWKLVSALVNRSWGVELVVSTAGFLEYLLDRRTEFHVSGSAAKYEILARLARSVHWKAMVAEGRVAPGTAKQVNEYVAQGAHYAPLTVGVMGPVSGAR